MYNSEITELQKKRTAYMQGLNFFQIWLKIFITNYDFSYYYAEKGGGGEKSLTSCDIQFLAIV